MGLLADFFVAPSDQALLYEDSLADRAASVATYGPAGYKNLTGLEPGILWAMLAGVEWSVDEHMLTEVRMGDGGETWLFRFPTPLVELLAGLSDEALDTAATRWADTEELEMWSPEHTRALLLDLRRLSKDSKSTGNGLYLWGSL